jgi:hypothetical protein
MLSRFGLNDQSGAERTNRSRINICSAAFSMCGYMTHELSPVAGLSYHKDESMRTERTKSLSLEELWEYEAKHPVSSLRSGLWQKRG